MTKRPLWTCPKCGHRFVTRNLWHSCVRVPLAAHFEGRDPIVRSTFRRWVATARAFGPVTVYAQKTRIVFMTRVRFSGATIRRGHVIGHLWLKRRAEHLRITRVEKLGRADYVHAVRLERPEDVDAALVRLMGEAYAIGRQDAPPRLTTPGRRA